MPRCLARSCCVCSPATPTRGVEETGSSGGTGGTGSEGTTAATESIAAMQGETHTLRVVVITASGHVANDLGHADGLLAWQYDHEADASAITGQAQPAT